MNISAWLGVSLGILILMFLIWNLLSWFKLAWKVMDQKSINSVILGFVLFIIWIILSLFLSHILYTMIWVIISIFALFLMEYWSIRLFIITWCLDKKYLNIYTLLLVLHIIVEITYTYLIVSWKLLLSRNLKVIDDILNTVLIVYVVFIMYNMYLRFSVKKVFSFIYSLPIISFFSFPIIINKKLKDYQPCDWQKIENKPETNNNEKKLEN